MYNTDTQFFDVIDVDPFGSFVPFLNSSINSIRNNGLLCLTSTDSKVLYGSDKAKCFYNYRSLHNKNPFKQETGLRIALNALSTVANMNGKGIRVLLSYQSDFYVRLFVEVINKRQAAADSLSQTGFQFYCDKCNYIDHFLFGRKTRKGVQINDFDMPRPGCDDCKSSLKLSKIKRWTFMAWKLI